jgi:CBS domain-containing protein
MTPKVVSVVTDPRSRGDAVNACKQDHWVAGDIENGKLVGSVTEGDFLQRAEPGGGFPRTSSMSWCVTERGHDS